MEPATYNLTLYQGATWSREMTLKDGSGNVVDLSHYSARMTIRPTPIDSAIVQLTSSAGGGIVLAATSPNIVVTVSARQTAVMSFISPAYYDLELVSSDGITVDRLLMGRVTLSREVTT
jgi:hypothetical protein